MHGVRRVFAMGGRAGGRGAYVADSRKNDRRGDEINLSRTRTQGGELEQGSAWLAGLRGKLVDPD
ncbi:MAG: hypothetical protein ACLR8P_08090 [Clostridium fessum]